MPVKSQPRPSSSKDELKRANVASTAIDWAKSLLSGFVLFLLIRMFVVQTFVVTSGSMEGTLLIGDLLVLNKVAYGATLPKTQRRLPGYTEPKHGDVVVFRAQHEPLDVIKRVVGLPGDTLEMRNQQLIRNGVPQIELYVKHSDPNGTTDSTEPRMSAWQHSALVPDPSRPQEYKPSRDTWGPIVVPHDSVFVLGDNREESLDSRFWGFLDRRRIRGKAEFLYYSYDRTRLAAFAWITDVRWSRIGERIQ